MLVAANEYEYAIKTESGREITLIIKSNSMRKPADEKRNQQRDIEKKTVPEGGGGEEQCLKPGL